MKRLSTLLLASVVAGLFLAGIAAASYDEALDHFESLLATVTNLTDSVFVLMDLENTYYEMSLSGCGISSSISSFTEYNRRMEELRRLVEGPNQEMHKPLVGPDVAAMVEASPTPSTPLQG